MGDVKSVARSGRDDDVGAAAQAAGWHSRQPGVIGRPIAASVSTWTRPNDLMSNYRVNDYSDFVIACLFELPRLSGRIERWMLVSPMSARGLIHLRGRCSLVVTAVGRRGHRAGRPAAPVAAGLSSPTGGAPSPKNPGPFSDPVLATPATRRTSRCSNIPGRTWMCGHGQGPGKLDAPPRSPAASTISSCAGRRKPSSDAGRRPVPPPPPRSGAPSPTVPRDRCRPSSLNG